MQQGVVRSAAGCEGEENVTAELMPGGDVTAVVWQRLRRKSCERCRAPTPGNRMQVASVGCCKAPASGTHEGELQQNVRSVVCLWIAARPVHAIAVV